MLCRPLCGYPDPFRRPFRKKRSACIFFIDPAQNFLIQLRIFAKNGMGLIRDDIPGASSEAGDHRVRPLPFRDQPSLQDPLFSIADRKSAVRDHGHGRAGIMGGIPFQILHPSLFVAAHEQAELVLQRHGKLPQALHHIQHSNRGPLVVLRAPSDQKISLSHRLKGFIPPAVPRRHHVQMIPEADHVVPVLFPGPDASHIIPIIFRDEAVLSSDLQHLVHHSAAPLSERSRAGSRVGNARDPHQPHDVRGQLLPMRLKPGACPHIQLSVHIPVPLSFRCRRRQLSFFFIIGILSGKNPTEILTENLL